MSLIVLAQRSATAQGSQETYRLLLIFQMKKTRVDLRDTLDIKSLDHTRQDIDIVFAVQDLLFSWSKALAVCCFTEVALQFLDFVRDDVERGLWDVCVCGDCWLRHDRRW